MEDDKEKFNSEEAYEDAKKIKVVQISSETSLLLDWKATQREVQRVVFHNGKFRPIEKV